MSGAASGIDFLCGFVRFFEQTAQILQIRVAYFGDDDKDQFRNDALIFMASIAEEYCNDKIKKVIIENVKQQLTKHMLREPLTRSKWPPNRD